MARRRLQTILASTVLATGMASMPAWAGPLQDAGDAVQDTASAVEETVDSTNGGVATELEESAEQVLDPTASPSPSETSSSEEDDGPIDLEVDIAPSDEDGSPQLEVDGGVTVGDQKVDVGSTTDPVEDAVDPDPEPSPSASESADTNEGTGGSGSNVGDTTSAQELHQRGNLQAAGGAPRTAPNPASSGGALGESFAAFGALNRGTPWAAGMTWDSNGTTTSQQVPAPRVADPLQSSEPLGQSIENPSVADEEVAQLATQTGPMESDNPLSAALKALAAALVLGTGVTAKRKLDEA